MNERKFIGRVGRTVAETDYKYETIEKHPKDAPNVVYIVLDDLGFAGLGCYGSNISTPNIDKLAAEGLRYNNFHTTAICSATRASLLTGANHHAVGVGCVVDMRTECTNGQGHISSSYGTLAEMLHEYGYANFAAGKWHLSSVQNPAGPYDNWPLGRGFDRYYGFLAGAIDQFNPTLVRDNSLVSQPKSAKDGYHISEDITDNAIDYIYTQKNAYPDQPFFLYLAYGAMHEPHHAPKEYIDKYKGKFDEGWDKIREQWFENQKRMGLIPEEAELTERAPYVDAWEDLDEDHKKVYARYMEVFAGFLEHTDAQIGRVIDYLESINQLDNTIIVLMSDNGASAEGGKEGRFNSNSGMDLTTVEDEVEYAIKHLDEMGTEYSYQHYPTGWANALNTPFQWYKSFAHEGGVKDPLIIRYPKLIKDGGAVRNQYHHVSDITPTILDIIGVEKPKSIKGVAQKPFTGISLKYTLENPEEKSRKHVQYYEMVSNLGLYKDGWKAVVNHTFNDSYEEDEWELYHVEKDYSEKYNVADKYPEKLKELREEFYLEAGRNNVFPILSGGYLATRDKLLDMLSYKKIPEGNVSFKNIFKPIFLTEEQSRYWGNNNHDVTAQLVAEGKEGVIASHGGRFGGQTFYIKDNRLKYAYKTNRDDLYSVESEHELPAGEITVKYSFRVNDGKAQVKIFVNNQEEGAVTIENPYFLPCGESVIGANLYTEVANDYEVPFAFTGVIQSFNIHSYGTLLNLGEELAKSMHVE